MAHKDIVVSGDKGFVVPRKKCKGKHKAEPVVGGVRPALFTPLDCRCFVASGLRKIWVVPVPGGEAEVTRKQ